MEGRPRRMWWLRRMWLGASTKTLRQCARAEDSKEVVKETDEEVWCGETRGEDVAIMIERQ